MSAMRASRRVSSSYRIVVVSARLSFPVSTGKFEEIAGIDSYVATPSTDYPKDKVLILITDVFGSSFINNQVRSNMNLL